MLTHLINESSLIVKSTPLRKVDIDDNSRIALYYDEWTANNPTDDDYFEHIGVFTIDSPNGAGYFDRDITDGCVLDDIDEYLVSSARFELAMAYLKENGYITKEVTVNGVSQGDWMKLLVYTKEPGFGTASLDEFITYVKTWFSGNVMIIAYQEKKTYTAEDGDTVSFWITKDFINDWYMHDYMDDEALLITAQQNLEMEKV